MNKILLNKQVLIFYLFLLPINLWPQIFTDSGISLPGVTRSSVAWGDYDNDGDLDFLLTGSTDPKQIDGISKIFRNDAGNFSDIKAELNGFIDGSISWCDYDNDKDLDVLLTGVSDRAYTTKIYCNDAGVFFDINAGLPGVAYGAASWGDYDNDGDMDVLLTGLDNSFNFISKIYCNDSNNTFTEQSSISLTGVHESSVAWGDYDNDGDLDILLSGLSADSGGMNGISKIYRNDSGIFSDINAELHGARYDCSVAWGDYDSDGDLDILLTGSDISKIYSNNAGIFKDINAGLTGVTYSSAGWGDYDNDGDLDVLITGLSGEEYISKIYRNDAGGFFDTDAGLTDIYHGSIAWGDYDNDGDLDILLSGDSYSGYISKIYENNTASANSIPEVPSSLQSSVTGTGVVLSWDKANDSQTCQYGLSYNIYIGTEAGAINKKPPMAQLPDGYRFIVQRGDIQNNTWMLALRGLTAAGTYYWSVQSIDNCFAGSAFANEQSFTIPFSNVIYPTDDQIIGIYEVDNVLTVNESSTPDSRQWKYSLVSGGPYDHVITDATDPTFIPSFSTYGTYYVICESTKDNVGYLSNEVKITVTDFIEHSGFWLPGIRNSSVSWGDYDNDRDLDILLTGQNISKIYRNDAGVFIDVNAGLTDVDDGSVAWGDYDNDGDLDILITGYSGEGLISKIFRNDDGVFFDINAGLPGVDCGSVAWGDYDNDGDLDILLCGKSTLLGYDYISKIFRNEAGTFTDIGAGLTGVDCGSVSWGDYDNDGDLDVLLSGYYIKTGGYSWNANVNILEIYCNENGIFRNINATLWAAHCGYAEWGDYDGDGDLDLMVAGMTGDYEIGWQPISKIYRYDGNNIYTDIYADITIITVGSAAWGDYDNDGDQDILISGNCYDDYGDTHYGITKIYRNDKGVFADVNSNLKVAGDGSVSWIDYDNDGDLDISLISEDIAAIYRNTLGVTNSIPSEPFDLQSEITEKGINLIWNDATDTETTLNGLSYNLYIGSAPGTANIASPMASLTDGYRKIVQRGLIQDNSWTIKKLQAGTYYWSVQAIDSDYAGGKWATESSFTLTNSVDASINDNPFNILFNIYPNPTTGLFTIEIDNNIFGELMISVTTEQGKKILETRVEKSTEHFITQIDLNGQPEGLYVISLLINRYLSTRKIIIE